MMQRSITVWDEPAIRVDAHFFFFLFRETGMGGRKNPGSLSGHGGGLLSWLLSAFLFVFCRFGCLTVKYNRLACGSRFPSSPLRRVSSQCGGITVGGIVEVGEDKMLEVLCWKRRPPEASTVVVVTSIAFMRCFFERSLDYISLFVGTARL